MIISSIRIRLTSKQRHHIRALIPKFLVMGRGEFESLFESRHVVLADVIDSMLQLNDIPAGEAFYSLDRDVLTLHAMLKGTPSAIDIAVLVVKHGGHMYTARDISAHELEQMLDRVAYGHGVCPCGETGNVVCDGCGVDCCYSCKTCSACGHVERHSTEDWRYKDGIIHTGTGVHIKAKNPEEIDEWPACGWCGMISLSAFDDDTGFCGGECEAGFNAYMDLLRGDVAAQEVEVCEEGMYSEEECAICLDELGRGFVTPCPNGHSFHYHCWLSHKKRLESMNKGVFCCYCRTVV